MLSLPLALLNLLTLFDRDAPARDERPTCFLEAYPGIVCAADEAAITLCSGARVPWDDGRDKTHAQRLEDADLEDTVAVRYRPGRDYPPPPLDFEPGRLREHALLAAMYGDSRDAVHARTTEIPWMPRSGGRPIRVTTVNGVAAALARVSDDLERELPPDLRALVAETAGVFVWRTVRGAQRRSPHSYAIAIDIGVARSDYWDWHPPDADGRYRYKNRFPLEVVAIFERHGFIWGGKWYHFDTMHFEYRPELLVAPCVDGPSPLATLGGKELSR